MTTAAPKTPRHRAAPTIGTPTPLSRSAWQRVRRSLTAGVFLATTVAAVGIGLQGASVSPVSPVAAAPVAAPAPVAGTAPVVRHSHGPRR